MADHMNNNNDNNNSISTNDWETPSNIVPIEYTTVIRSLRRRLWKAFYEEDIETAIRAYTANIHDYELWIQEEADAAEAERLQKEEEEKEQLRIEEENQKRSRKSPGGVKLSSFRVNKSKRNNSNSSMGSHNMSPSISSPKNLLSKSFRKLTKLGSSRSNFTASDIDEESSSKSLKPPPPPPPLPRPPPRINVPPAAASTRNNINKTDSGVISNGNGNNNVWEKQPGILQLQMIPSDPFVIDDFRSPYDSFETDEEINAAAAAATAIENAAKADEEYELSKKRAKQQRKARQPRLAFFGRRLSKQRLLSSTTATSTAALTGGTTAQRQSEDNNPDHESSSNAEESESISGATTSDENTNMTTPLHEAARLGSGKLVELMLNHVDVDPNYRNGKSRTALHMAAGGLTDEEEALLLIQQSRNARQKTDSNNNKRTTDEGKQHKSILGPNVGIRSPKATDIEDIDDDDENNDGPVNNKKSSAKKAAKAMGKFFRKSMKFNKVNGDDKGHNAIDNSNNSLNGKDDSFEFTLFDIERLNKIQNDRMSAVLALLSWKHPEDNTVRAGEGATVNSVDSRGRTALHYSAELGRASICIHGILSDFGVILTIVDESGLTPCELAGEHTHDILAYQLEARALLYTDPYGMDDELMASMLADEQYNTLNGSNGGGNSAINTVDDDSAGNLKSDNPKSSEQQPKKKERTNRTFQYRSKLAPPFSWFETWNMDDVDIERSEMVDTTLESMKDILREIHHQNEINEMMFSHANNDSLMLDNEGLALALEDSSMNECAAEMAACEAANAGDALAAALLASKADENNHDDSKKESTATSDNPDKLATENSTKPKEEVSAIQIVLDHIHELHVERYLQYHGWDKKSAIAAFKESPVEALIDADVSFNFDNTASTTDLLKSLGLIDEDKDDSLNAVSCQICLEEYSPSSSEWIKLEGCSHEFCSTCLGDFITESARTKESGLAIVCPHHNCNCILSQSEVQTLAPSAEVYESLVEAANENFVTSAVFMRFCPFPGCEGVVRRMCPNYLSKANEETKAFANLAGATCTCVLGQEDTSGDDNNIPRTYEGVKDENLFRVRNMSQPPKAHRFCFSCGDHMHWPITCETLEEWKKTIDEEVGDLGDENAKAKSEGDFNDLAQRLWMKANTRPCPQCKAPIEKNDGCNHMTCTNRSCRHEFCWICRKDWKLHNTETGGFYRCNRWQDEDTSEYYDKPPDAPEQVPRTADGNDQSNAADQGYGTAVHAARSAWKKSRQMARFLHHYRRWSAHKESAELERNMAETVCIRLAPVVDAAIDFNGFEDFDFGGKGISFIHAAFTELLECRSFLQHSYAFAFHRYPTFYYYRNNRWVKPKEPEKKAFELMQSELEMLIEQLSDIVARSHLRATQTQIVYLTVTAAEKRGEMTKFMISIHDEARKEQERKKKDEKGNGRTISPQSSSRQVLRPPTGEGILPHNDVRRNEEALPAEEAAVREALQASLQQMELGPGGFRRDAAQPRFDDWACPACTYQNTTGRNCAMCGTQRS